MNDHQRDYNELEERRQRERKALALELSHRQYWFNPLWGARIATNQTINLITDKTPFSSPKTINYVSRTAGLSSPKLYDRNKALETFEDKGLEDLYKYENNQSLLSLSHWTSPSPKTAERSRDWLGNTTGKYSKKPDLLQRPREAVAPAWYNLKYGHDSFVDRGCNLAASIYSRYASSITNNYISALNDSKTHSILNHAQATATGKSKDDCPQYDTTGWNDFWGEKLPEETKKFGLINGQIDELNDNLRDLHTANKKLNEATFTTEGINNLLEDANKNKDIELETIIKQALAEPKPEASQDIEMTPMLEKDDASSEDKRAKTGLESKKYTEKQRLQVMDAVTNYYDAEQRRAQIDIKANQEKLKKLRRQLNPKPSMLTNESLFLATEQNGQSYITNSTQQRSISLETSQYHENSNRIQPTITPINDDQSGGSIQLNDEQFDHMVQLYNEEMNVKHQGNWKNIESKPNNAFLSGDWWRHGSGGRKVDFTGDNATENQEKAKEFTQFIKERAPKLKQPHIQATTTVERTDDTALNSSNSPGSTHF